jgi:hypothetical protein
VPPPRGTLRIDTPLQAPRRPPKSQDVAALLPHPDATPISSRYIEATGRFPLHTPNALTRAKSGCPTLQAHTPGIVARLLPTHALFASFVAFHIFPFILIHPQANTTPQPPITSLPFVTRAEHHLNQSLLPPSRPCNTPLRHLIHVSWDFSHRNVCQHNIRGVHTEPSSLNSGFNFSLAFRFNSVEKRTSWPPNPS